MGADEQPAMGGAQSAMSADEKPAMGGAHADEKPATDAGAHADEKPAMGASGSDSSTESAAPVMKCFWTARAELGIGALIVILGALLIVFKSRQLRIGLSLAAALNGILALLVPTLLIGVCDHASMQCRIGTLPALVILSSFVIAVAALNAIYLFRSYSKEPLSE
jgi:hypothetical protein